MNQYHLKGIALNLIECEIYVLFLVPDCYEGRQKEPLDELEFNNMWHKKNLGIEASKNAF